MDAETLFYGIMIMENGRLKRITQTLGEDTDRHIYKLVYSHTTIPKKRSLGWFDYKSMVDDSLNRYRQTLTYCTARYTMYDESTSGCTLILINPTKARSKLRLDFSRPGTRFKDDLATRGNCVFVSVGVWGDFETGYDFKVIDITSEVWHIILSDLEQPLGKVNILAPQA
ncbi:hypothetical protein EJ05DRAFT_487337 [Pseudovirgaria hyperparasitica]|uniref:Uncharacterized protein n=1 Tax=Pseudovirgaria hyperparasitica TaxID=470096 RepID=A0A6A6W5U9_9PEZI|nr:uncharacterized protein EJ05DRAFT_487337 [Pseudovirgaria hyperparasitica]KAF2756431.1 hypothetical protein EJ05DRAFT_487337 [Pseudovirgaria hyperparasitica]